MAVYWTVPPEWQGQTAFIVAGGVSVENQNTELLRGRRVIAVNSSYERVPFADILFFGDSRWLYEHYTRPELVAFGGRIVTPNRSVQTPDNRILKVRRVVPTGPDSPGLVLARDSVVSQRTSLQGAINLAAHLIGATSNPGAMRYRIVILGADMARAPDGRTHHHTPHKWQNKPGNRTWDIQMTQLVLAVPVLKSLGVEVINASPVSRISWWPKRNFDESLLADLDANRPIIGTVESSPVPNCPLKFVYRRAPKASSQAVRRMLDRVRSCRV